MQKHTTQRKTCHITNNFQLQQHTTEFLTNLLKSGFCHFYFTNFTIQYDLIKQMLKTQKSHKTIKIFVVYNYKNPFWRIENIENLPVKINNENDEQKELTKYLEKYCDKVL